MNADADDRARSVRLLLVEDDRAHVALVRELLAGAPFGPYAMRAVGSLGEVRSVLRTERPDVVVLDLGLPDVDGLSAAGAIAAIDPEVPVVVLTGRTDPQGETVALRMQVQDYLHKDRLDRTTLAEALRNAIERHRVLRSLALSNDRMKHLIRADPTTGAHNRLALTERADESDPREPLGAVIVDLDGLSQVSAAVGPLALERLLIGVANALRHVAAARPVGRPGFARLMVLCPGDRATTVARLAAAARVRIEPLLAEVSGLVTATVTTALLDPGTHTLDALIAAAEVPPPADGPLRASAEPIVDLDSREPVGALLSVGGAWGQRVLPAQLGEVALDPHLATLAARAMLTLGIEAARAHGPGVHTHVALPAGGAAGLGGDAIARALSATSTPWCVHLDPGLVDDVLSLVPLRDSLSAAGVKVALDGFDASRVALEAFLALAPDAVVLPAPMVAAALGDPRAMARLERMAGLASRSGVRVIAGGVPPHADLDALRDAGVQAAVVPG